MFTAGKTPTLVVSGLALANPHVGQGVYTLRLIQGLAKYMGRDFVVIAPFGAARPAGVREDNFLRLSSISALRPEALNNAVTSARLLSFVAKTFPNAVFHSPGPICGPVKPAKTIVTLHDCIYRRFPIYNGRFGNRRLLSYATERFAAKASLVLTDSEFSKRDLIAKARIPKSKIEVLYPWVGNEFLQPIPPNDVSILRSRLGLPPRFWLYLGGYDFRKNVEFLLAAYSAATTRRELPPLVLAGTIPKERSPTACDVVGALGQTNLRRDQVLFPGPIEVDDLPLIYRAASLLIYPSLMEGFGLPPAEAMSVGTPVLAANNSSLPEVLRKSERLFDAMQPESLVAKLLAAADSENQFLADFPPEFTEAHGISRYLQLIEQRVGI